MNDEYDISLFPEENRPLLRLKDVIPAPVRRERDSSPWGMLMNAVVIQAVEDYRVARETLRYDPKNADARKMIMDVEFFLLSEDCLLYTELPGGMILEKLEKEQEEILWKSGKRWTRGN